MVYDLSFADNALLESARRTIGDSKDGDIRNGFQNHVLFRQSHADLASCHRLRLHDLDRLG